MRGFLSTLAVLALAAIPASAAVTFTTINLSISDGTAGNTCAGCSFLPVSFSDNGWTATGDLDTSTTGTGPFVSTLGTAFEAGLDNFTLVCGFATCGAETVTFTFDGVPASTGGKNLPYEVEVLGTDSLSGKGNFTYRTSLAGSTPINLSGSNFDTIITGVQHFNANADIMFTGTIQVAGGTLGEQLTLPADTTFNAPEPGTMGLLGCALMGLGALGFRRRNRG